MPTVSGLLFSDANDFFGAHVIAIGFRGRAGAQMREVEVYFIIKPQAPFQAVA
jgi:hypothetical protein